MQVILTIATFIVFIVFWGYLILRLILLKNLISFIDKIIFSTTIGLFVNLAIFVLFDALGIKIEAQSLLSLFGITLLTSFLVKKPIPERHKLCVKKNNFFLFLSLLVMIVLRVPAVLSHPLPYSTDLSHHIFYSRYIVEKGILPDYSRPEFVLMEHVLLSLAPVFTGVDILGVSPYIILSIVNILASFVIYRIIFYSTKSFLSSLTGLLISSVFFLYTPFNLTYVIGGVVGNILGNFLIATFVLSLVIFFEKKCYRFLPLVVIDLVLIINSHTVSTVILFWITTTSIIFYAIFNFSLILATIKELFSRKNVRWFFVSFMPLLVFIFYIPNYFIDERATGLIDSSLPSGQIHEWSLEKVFSNQYLNIIPSGMYLVTIISLIIFFFSKKRDNFSKYLFVFWFLIPFFYTVSPGLFFIHLPADRTINYIFSPIVLAVSLFTFYLTKKQKKIVFFVLIILSFTTNFGNLYKDIIAVENNTKIMNENKEGFVFLSGVIKENENVFTDHTSSLLADQAIKNYLDFSNFVIYKTYLFRYENGDQTWDTWKMMEDPVDNLSLYVENSIRYVVVPNTDSYKNKFQETNIASNIFENDTLVIFEMK